MKNIKESKYFNRTDSNITALIEADKRVIENIRIKMKMLHERLNSTKEELEELKKIMEYREKNNIHVENNLKLMESKS